MVTLAGVDCVDQAVQNSEQRCMSIHSPGQQDSLVKSGGRCRGRGHYHSVPLLQFRNVVYTRSIRCRLASTLSVLSSTLESEIKVY